jgi:hypothetical protein
MINQINTCSFLCLFFLASCAQENEVPISSTPTKADTLHKTPFISVDSSGVTVETRFTSPPGYKRIQADDNSFADYLRKLPVKPVGSLVSYYDGTEKPNFDTYAAVIDLPVGNKNLHQCADAIMRLRAEYLWNNGDFEKIHFNFTNGFRVDYTKWLDGKRMVVNGNNTYWRNGPVRSTSYGDFWQYMELIFNYAGTLSLSKEMQEIAVQEMRIGDVFIIGGSPGHAVIVIDMAENESTGKKKFMLAQSYMPAQELQVLQNPSEENSPWYDLDFEGDLVTPEWTFTKEQLKRFRE